MKYFITFGAGGTDFIDAGNRLLNQAKSTNVFDECYLYTDKDLKENTEFWSRHSEFILSNKRGYGYWLWKPYIIKKVLENLKDDDILLYSDCGCEIDVRHKHLFNNMFDQVNKDQIVGTYTFCQEKHWNKMDLILELKMKDNKYLDSLQHQASTIMFLVNDNTRKLVDEWYKIACKYHLLDDSPSKNENCFRFREHRHDQAIFSLLTKKHNLYSKDCLHKKAVLIARNKTGKSKLK